MVLEPVDPNAYYRERRGRRARRRRLLMKLGFLTPLASILAVVALVPLAVFVGRERRARGLRRALGLPRPRRPVVALVLGVVVFVGFAIVVFNLLVDLLYSVLDPRVRTSRPSRRVRFGRRAQTREPQPVVEPARP